MGDHRAASVCRASQMPSPAAPCRIDYACRSPVRIPSRPYARLGTVARREASAVTVPSARIPIRLAMKSVVAATSPLRAFRRDSPAPCNSAGKGLRAGSGGWSISCRPLLISTIRCAFKIAGCVAPALNCTLSPGHCRRREIRAHMRRKTHERAFAGQEAVDVAIRVGEETRNGGLRGNGHSFVYQRRGRTLGAEQQRHRRVRTMVAAVELRRRRAARAQRAGVGPRLRRTSSTFTASSTTRLIALAVDDYTGFGTSVSKA